MQHAIAGDIDRSGSVRPAHCQAVASAVRHIAAARIPTARRVQHNPPALYGNQEYGIAPRRQHPARQRQDGRGKARQRHRGGFYRRGSERPRPKPYAGFGNRQRGGIERLARRLAREQFNSNFRCVNAAGILGAGFAERPHCSRLGVLRFDPPEACRADDFLVVLDHGGKLDFAKRRPRDFVEDDFHAAPNRHHGITPRA